MTLPHPPIAPDVDLKGFPFTPIFRARLFGSSFHARATDSEWRAGVTLWLKSWDQFPSGSLPDDDIDLCRLAELARDLKSWKKIKVGALHGWQKCSDGRLYHSVVAEGVNEAWNSKLKQLWASEIGRIKKHNQRHPDDQLPVPTFDQFLSQRHDHSVPGDSEGMSQGTGGGCPENVPEETPSNRDRHRQGHIAAVPREPSPWLVVGNRVMDMMEVRDDPNWFGDASPVQRWLAWGADPDLDIYPTVDRLLRRYRASHGGKPPRNLSFFDDAISEAHAKRLAPRPEVTNVNGTRPAGKQPRRTAEDALGELRSLRPGGPGALEPIDDAAGGIVIDQAPACH